MNKREFEEIISRGREQQGVEFKSPGKKTDKSFFPVIAKAIMGMANRRDGGMVIIGIKEEDDKLVLMGLSEDQLKTWKYNGVADTLHNFVEPDVSFDIEEFQYNSKTYVILNIEEFFDTPILCRRDYKDILQSGVCYVRTRRKPETLSIPTHAEMRDLLEIAAEKSTRRFIERMGNVGIKIISKTNGSDVDSSPNLDKYNSELESL